MTTLSRACVVPAASGYEPALDRAWTDEGALLQGYLHSPWLPVA
jgi:hypothetical protein